MTLAGDPARRAKGSLHWIRKAIAAPDGELDASIRAQTGVESIEWRSPLARDGFAEYRDLSFLHQVGWAELAPELRAFWPSRGPQWDALAVTDKRGVLLVEAKAHLRELHSPGSRATGAAHDRIAQRLDEVATKLGARPDRAPWIKHYYQIANRLAHLCFLRENGVNAWLVLVNFTGDRNMRGPASAAEWHAGYQVAWHVMGLPEQHALAQYVIDVFPDIATLP